MTAAATISDDRDKVYVTAPLIPTQEGPEGIRFDFNDGARVQFPKRESGSWRVTLHDLDAGVVLYHGDLKSGQLQSTKRYFLRYGIKITSVSEDGDLSDVMDYEFSPTGQIILVHIPVGTLGDAIAWFSYVPRFAEEMSARIICIMAAPLIGLFRDRYPEIEFLVMADVENSGLVDQAYATYRIGLFFTDTDNNWQPSDFRHVGLHKTAAYILGVSPEETKPAISVPDASRPIAERYVCIATQASSQCKYWNNPDGWRTVIAFLKKQGLRVICIDQKATHGKGWVWNHIPHGCEDETGDRPLQERARWLTHCEFFIGTSSGLAWLAWAAGARVVLISGFTHPTNEFYTPYRVINWNSCNSCWNDQKITFDHKNIFWCPRHENTDRQFECSRLITPEAVIATIQRIPSMSSDRGVK
ncbi:MAG: autotransporter strand-loop-strand O-heptosyltransferase [Acetobacter sp.]|uniref:autotransporter strand-loop-strand O-heptosyltransferase n=1 Tax=Acetobacter sp. TaxID=440 RepID=UPI0039ED0224